MNMTSALGSYLRQVTRDTHRNLDSHRVLRPLISPELRREDYMRALLALYPAQCQLEDAIHRGLHSLQLDYPLLSRSSALADDLTAMALPLPALDEPSGLEVSRPGQLIGMLYVLEGAKLGARVIAHNVKRCLGAQVPMRYFTVDQDNNSWDGFWQFARQHCSEPAEQNVAAITAVEAFRLFLACLDACPAADTHSCV